MNPAAVIACPGIGARFLGGIEDKNVYPIRGQTILLYAPWIKYGRTLSGADGSYVYMMPRSTGDVHLSFFHFAADAKRSTPCRTGRHRWDQGTQRLASYSLP